MADRSPPRRPGASPASALRVPRCQPLSRGALRALSRPLCLLSVRQVCGGGSIKGSRVFCFLKIHQLKIISIPKRHDLGWQTLLPLITELGHRVTPSSQSRWSGSWMRWASGRPRACTPELSPRQDRAPGRGGGPARPVPHRAGDPATGPGLASGWSARHEGGGRGGEHPPSPHQR